MSKFLEHLENEPWCELEGGYNEPIISLYIDFQEAARTKCDALTITPTEIVWSRAGNPVGSRSITGLQPDLGWRGYLKEILKQDQIVRDHMSLVADTPETVTYRITL